MNQANGKRKLGLFSTQSEEEQEVLNDEEIENELGYYGNVVKIMKRRLQGYQKKEDWIKCLIWGPYTNALGTKGRVSSKISS